MNLKNFPDGSVLEYGRGKFDDWCLFLSKDQMTFSPKESTTFMSIVKLAGIHGADKVYKDFIKIYDNTADKIDPHILNIMIDKLAREYSRDSTEINVLFSILYAEMVADENKVTPLGKKTKRLSLYQCLYEGKLPEDAINFIKGKRYMELERECIARGF